MTQENELIVFSEQKITAYDPFRSQLAELKKNNEKAVFDYNDPKGNKDARSHIYKLRQTKSAVDKVRKDQKQASLDYGRRVDAQAKEIIGEIEEMIDVHQKPLDEIEQREKNRVSAHQAKVDELQLFVDSGYESTGSVELKAVLDGLIKLEPDESFEEFTAPALAIWKQAKSKLETVLEARLKYESEQAELERLRKEQAEREQKEREERIAKEAAERAKAEAEEQAKAEREAAAKRELEAKAAQERAEQARIAAEEKAKRDAEEAEKRQAEAVRAAEERARREAEEAKRREEEEARKREADKKHRAAINNAALDALVSVGATKALAKSIVEAIAKGQVPNVRINY